MSILTVIVVVVITAMVFFTVGFLLSSCMGGADTGRVCFDEKDVMYCLYEGVLYTMTEAQ